MWCHVCCFTPISHVAGGSALLAHGDSFLLLINKPETKYTVHIHDEPSTEPFSYAWQHAGELRHANSATTEPASDLQASLIRSTSIPQHAGVDASRGATSLDSRTAGGLPHGDGLPTMLLLCGAPGSGVCEAHACVACSWLRGLILRTSVPFCVIFRVRIKLYSLLILSCLCRQDHLQPTACRWIGRAVGTRKPRLDCQDKRRGQARQQATVHRCCTGDTRPRA